MKILFITCLLATCGTVHVVGQDDMMNTEEECCEDYCFGSDRDRPQTRQYSTKTTYEVVRGGDYGKHYEVLNCQPSKMWFLSRHGTRNPSSPTIQEMQKLEALRDQIVQNFEQRKSGPRTGGLCQGDKSLLKMWKLNKNMTEYPDVLTLQGWQDMKFLAKNYQRNFETILEKQYDSNKFLFRTTNTQRTIASYKAFIEGLFGDAAERVPMPTPQTVDNILQSFQNCPKWVEHSKAYDGPDTEVTKFENSPIMKKTLHDISRRLGFRFQLERSQVRAMWDMCRFEQAWHVDRSSAWCVAFTPEQVTVLEYAEDLKYYYQSGYESELNERIACSTVKDMLLKLNSTSQPQAIAYFAHSNTLRLFLTAMGIAKDSETLRADNYYQMKDRKWKTSLLSPFAANFAAVKYQCLNNLQDSKVMFFINQSPVELEWCRVGLCNWGEVMINYEKFLNADCDKYFCDQSSSATLQLSISLWLTIIFFYFLKIIKF